MTIQPTVNPRIVDVKTARDEMAGFVKNPPQDPVSAVKRMGDMMGLGAVVSTGLTAAFPMVGPILPALSGIFELFGSGGPSLGEMTFDAIVQLSGQIDAGFKMLSEHIETVVETQAQRTIDVVLSGVDEVAREASAAQVFAAYNTAAAMDIVRKAKQENYTVYLKDLQTLREQSLNQIRQSLEAAQAYVREKFNKILTQIYAMIAELAPEILEALNSYLEPAAEVSARALPGGIESAQSSTSAKSSNSLIILAAGAAALFFIAGKKR